MSRHRKGMQSADAVTTLHFVFNALSASEMIYIVSGGPLNSTHFNHLDLQNGSSNLLE